MVAVGAFGEVIERAEQEDGVVRGVWGAQLACVAEFDGGACLLGLFYVARDRVDEMYAVTVLDESPRVRARTSADIEDACGRRWQMAAQQFLGAHHLQVTIGCGERPVDLVGGLGVEPHNLRRRQSTSGVLSLCARVGRRPRIGAPSSGPASVAARGTARFRGRLRKPRDRACVRVAGGRVDPSAGCPVGERAVTADMYKPGLGDLVEDAGSKRTGEVMGFEGPYVQLRPVGGGREWDAMPECLRPLTRAEALRVAVAVANARSRASREERP